MIDYPALKVKPEDYDTIRRLNRLNELKFIPNLKSNIEISEIVANNAIKKVMNNE